MEMTMDYVGLRDSHIEKARKAEQAANARTNQIMQNAARDLEKRVSRWSQLPFSERQARMRDVMLEWRKTDAVWKSHVADNQWHIQQAIMYGTAANGEFLARIALYTSHLMPDGVASIHASGYTQK